MIFDIDVRDRLEPVALAAGSWIDLRPPVMVEAPSAYAAGRMGAMLWGISPDAVSVRVSMSPASDPAILTADWLALAIRGEAAEKTPGMCIDCSASVDLSPRRGRVRRWEELHLCERCQRKVSKPKAKKGKRR